MVGMLGNDFGSPIQWQAQLAEIILGTASSHDSSYSQRVLCHTDFFSLTQICYHLAHLMSSLYSSLAMIKRGVQRFLAETATLGHP